MTAPARTVSDICRATSAALWTFARAKTCPFERASGSFRPTLESLVGDETESSKKRQA